MIDKFDYAEPACPLCGGKEFYDPNEDAPLGRIPVGRILEKADRLFGKNDYAEAGRLLTYWRDEAIALRDKQGELSMESELVGYYRKQNDREHGLPSVARALALVDELAQGDMAAGATVFINCATAYKAFGMAEEALPLYQHAQETYQNTLSPNDERFGGLYNNMALTLQDLGELREAEAALFTALAIMETVPGGEAESAITCINLAHLYEALGETAMIAGCMEKALSLLQSERLMHDGAYAFVLEKCAPSFGYFGDTETCEKLQKEAEDIYARA